MQDRHQAALVRHAAFDAFGHELFELGGGVLEIAIGGAVALAMAPSEPMPRYALYDAPW